MPACLDCLGLFMNLSGSRGAGDIRGDVSPKGRYPDRASHSCAVRRRQSATLHDELTIERAKNRHLRRRIDAMREQVAKRVGH